MFKINKIMISGKKGRVGGREGEKKKRRKQRGLSCKPLTYQKKKEIL